jgi:NADH:ubiquinone oxidoreductase subunit E
MDSTALVEALSELADGKPRVAAASPRLLDALRHVQSRLGYLPPDAILGVADLLGASPAEVYGAATFFTNFRLTPRGKVLVRVCTGTACHVRGGDKVKLAVEQELGLTPGTTSADLSFTYETVNCVGACALAPTMVVEDAINGEVTPDRARDLLRQASEAAK